MEICLQKSSSNTAYLATQKGPIYFLKECLFVPPIFSTLLDSKSKVFRNEKEPANIQVLINKFGENIRYAETLYEIIKFFWLSPKIIGANFYFIFLGYEQKSNYNIIGI